MVRGKGCRTGTYGSSELINRVLLLGPERSDGLEVKVCDAEREVTFVGKEVRVGPLEPEVALQENDIFFRPLSSSHK